MNWGLCEIGRRDAKLLGKWLCQRLCEGSRSQANTQTFILEILASFCCTQPLQISPTKHLCDEQIFRAASRELFATRTFPTHTNWTRKPQQQQLRCEAQHLHLQHYFNEHISVVQVVAFQAHCLQNFRIKSSLFFRYFFWYKNKKFISYTFSREYLKS